MPFNSKKYRETKRYDVNPIILPMYHEESNDGDQDVANDNSNQGNSEPDTGPTTVTGNNDDVVLSEYVVCSVYEHYVGWHLCVCMCVCVCVSICTCYMYHSTSLYSLIQ